MAPGKKRQMKEEIEGAPPPSPIFSGDVANDASSSVTVDASAEGKGKAVARGNKRTSLARRIMEPIWEKIAEEDEAGVVELGREISAEVWWLVNEGIESRYLHKG
ncbi:hypothetical protein HN873_003600 [Arachis hypogaea]